MIVFVDGGRHHDSGRGSNLEEFWWRTGLSRPVERHARICTSRGKSSRNRSEGLAESGPDRRGRNDNAHRDKRRDQCVFDRSCACVVFQKMMDRAYHNASLLLYGANRCLAAETGAEVLTVSWGRLDSPAFVGLGCESVKTVECSLEGQKSSAPC